MRCWTFIMTTIALISLDAAVSRSNSEPLLTQGIGLQSCEKLRPDLKPGAGLNHMPNALLFYWFQGYLSAANIYLLKEHIDYVDIGTVDEATITQVVADFCEKNPKAMAIAAIDKFIREAKKIKAKRSDAFNPWKH
jgi:hypothetical protein